MKKVLIAEDEASIREFIVINLKRSGYDVVEAENGEEAINKYEEENGNIDVAVLDIMMPLKDGLEVCKYLRAKSSKIGIIMLTAKTQEMDKVTGAFGRSRRLRYKAVFTVRANGKGRRRLQARINNERKRKSRSRKPGSYNSR